MIAVTGGCANKESTTNGPTVPPAGSTSSPSVATASSPSPPLESAVTESENPYRVRTRYNGKTTVEFGVFVDGTQAGSYNAAAEADITPLLRPGKNTVRVTWTADPDMERYESALLYLETKRGGNWSTVLSREVRKDTAAGDTTLVLDTSGPEAAAPPVVGAEVSAAATPAPAESVSSESSVAAPSPAATVSPSPPALASRYSVKVDVNQFVPANFALTLNGTTIGDFTGDANQDITQDVRPGKNVLTIAWKHTGPVTNRFSDSTVVLGVERGGIWSTVANQKVGSGTKDGQRSVTFIAK
ncbi:MAG: hypothetical protein V4671_27420 [Armatimonadota bacterium]